MCVLCVAMVLFFFSFFLFVLRFHFRKCNYKTSSTSLIIQLTIFCFVLSSLNLMSLHVSRFPETNCSATFSFHHAKHAQYTISTRPQNTLLLLPLLPRCFVFIFLVRSLSLSLSPSLLFNY